MQKKSKLFFLIFLSLFIFINEQELFASSTVTLNANGPGNTYALIRSKGYGLEVPDCGHPTKHISEAWDNELGKYVFLLDVHRDLDDDRCVNNDRQRTEIKTYSVSPDNMKAQYGETHVFKWKFRLDKNYQPSDAFCHIHQITAGGGEDAAMPIVTISTRSGSPDVLRLAHSSSGSTGGIVKEVPLSLFRGVWVEVYEKIKNADNGTWEITIKRVDNGATLISYSNNKIDMWRTGASYNRSKYGIYRSLGDISSLRNERVRFADFSLTEGEGSQSPPPAPSSNALIDNTSTGFSSGPSSWPSSSFTSGYYGGNYKYAAPGNGGKWAKWVFQLNTAGSYDVYAQWSSSSNRSSAAPYTIRNNGNSWVVTANQTKNGGKFNRIGTFWLESGTVEVMLKDTSSGYVIADAVKLVSEGGGSSRNLDRIQIEGPVSVDENSGTDYLCRAYYTDGSSLLVSADSWSENSSYAGINTVGYLTASEVSGDKVCRITSSYNEGGITKTDIHDVTIKDMDTSTWSANVTIDNTNAGFASGPGKWPVSSFTKGYYGSNYQYAAPGNTGKLAKWTFQLNTTGNHKISARWSSFTNRATGATYTIRNNGKQWPVTVDQTKNGGQFNSLGVFWLTAGTVEVELTDSQTGYVIADAVKLEEW